MAAKFDPAIIEAEENLLIDFQFLLQEAMTQKGISLSELDEKAALSKSRISQIMGAEANPTTKTFARLFYALGERVVPELKKKIEDANLRDFKKAGALTVDQQPWQWTEETSSPGKRRDGQLVTLVKEAFPSNDNKVVVMESEVMTVLEAA